MEEPQGQVTDRFLDITRPISTILDGSNYIFWARGMKNFLIQHKLWYLIIGNITKPIQKEGEEEGKFLDRLEDWDSQNHLIITWFRNTSAPSVHQQFGRLDTAKEVWDFLANRYVGKSPINEYLLLDTLQRMKQKDKQPVHQLIEQMKAVWDQLAVFEPTWECITSAETYNAYQDRQRVIQFLMALSDDFELIRASLLHRQPAPTLEVAISEILSEETRLNSRKPRKFQY